MSTTHLIAYSKDCVPEHAGVAGGDAVPDELRSIVLQVSTNRPNALFVCADISCLDQQPPLVKWESPDSGEETKHKERSIVFLHSMTEALVLSGKDDGNNASGGKSPSLLCA
jgi:hypothetical protein